MTVTVEQLVEQIRDWECDAGEGFTDYFLDRHSYNGQWEEFLLSKGFTDLVEEIRADVYVLQSGEKLGCTDQQLKFEPYSMARENEGLDWEEDVYRQDVALWAEFILGNEKVLADYNEWLAEQNAPHEDDD